ncbi:imidazoleglycerol-phosphate dehydratase HisB [Candidatus Neomarinimicrobiota bacterium]
MSARKPIEIQRKTNETSILLTLRLDGDREIKANTGIGFFDHMLESLAFWAGWDLTVNCTGDLQVDSHHTVEDVALVLGQGFAEACADAHDIERFGSAFVPMDDALTQVVIDLSGRPYAIFHASFNVERIGAFETAMTGHFFRSFASEAGINLHVRSIYGEDPHHIIESMFKALGLALRQALIPRTGGVASTKGVV